MPGACCFCGCERSQTPSLVTSMTSTDSQSSSKVFSHAAVVTDSKIASDIGNDLLMSRGGNAVDAAVAALLATGVISMHSCGIGGGSLYVVYTKYVRPSSRKQPGWHALDSRETAPQGASENMFNNSDGSSRRHSSRLGGMAIGVPGEVKGLFEVHKEFGRLTWEDVVMPTVKLCESGVPLTGPVRNVLKHLSDHMKEEFSEYFDSNGAPKTIGTPIRLPALAKTFRVIAKSPEAFYSGSLAESIVADIRDAGGIITFDDIKNYQVKWRPLSVMNLPGDFSVYSIPPPGSGPVLGYILNILSGYNFTPASLATDESSVLTYHRIVEAMKFAFAERSKLGDSEGFDETAQKLQRPVYGEATRKRINDHLTQEIEYYRPVYQIHNNHGTAHISVIDADGNAVSVTSTINTYLGSHVRGRRTGIVFNNEMDDFSTPGTPNYYGFPPSPANFIKPGKRPMSSMCPAIVFDNNKKRVKLVTGAAGGSTITTTTAMNIMDVLWFGRPLPTSMKLPRLHHQLLPSKIQVEDKYPENILQGLKKKGHNIGRMSCKSVIQAVEVRDEGIFAVADFRKGGVPSGY